MTVRKFRPPNRLASLIKDKGGILAQDAIAAAEVGVESLRESSMAALDESLAEIERRFGKSAADRAAEPFEVLYHLASKVIDVSLFVTDAGIDKAAMSLCGLADSCAEAGAWRWDAVDVHLNALKLLRAVGAELPAAQRDAMLQGLYQVSHYRPDEA
ncbi:chemotaxis protein CheE [Caulobacter sp. RHG1]|uniref:chemotaxis protein CheE n=1 Tax=Caulobacter sp. (strain RHG1) TaxID=2545762 RepID=UPI00155182B1|nr:chemotaxis protein CheE [Caulobacter sp. RHG1]NQE63534.1 CheE protein [Caulobacter sp. RHG1]